MPRNGSGGYSPPNNSWNPAINGNLATPNDWMDVLNDLSSAIQSSVASDGQTPITGDLKMTNNRIVELGSPGGQGHALRWEQMYKGPNIASATNIAIPAEGTLFDVTGTTQIESITISTPGRVAYLRCLGELTIKNGASLKTPLGSDLVTIAGEVYEFILVDNSVWEVRFTREIVESGSNSQGTYIRFANGWQICTQSTPLAMSGTAWTPGTGLSYLEVAGAIGYPAPFLTGSPPDLDISIRDSNVSARSAYLSAATANATNITGIFFASPNPAAPGGGTIRLGYTAKGRWK